jgi:hypothetical protein
MWNLTDKDKVAENGAIMKQKLEALVGVGPGLLRAEVGVGFNGYDVALYTELEDRAALAVYATIRPTARSGVRAQRHHANACAVITRYKGPPSHPARRSFGPDAGKKHRTEKIP